MRKFLMTFHNAKRINEFDLRNFQVMIFFGPNIYGYQYGIDKSYHITIVLIINNLTVVLINILRKNHLVGFLSLFNKENNLCHLKEILHI